MLQTRHKSAQPAGLPHLSPGQRLVLAATLGALVGAAFALLPRPAAAAEPPQPEFAFPVTGEWYYGEGYGAARQDPYPHAHDGIDVYAPDGTPIVAVEGGQITLVRSSGAGGNALFLSGDSGMGYYYAHLRNFAPGAGRGQQVEKGSVIAFMGRSGNVTGRPHLHLQLHPATGNGPGEMGSPSVDPRSFLDAITDPEEIPTAAVAPAAVVTPPPAVPAETKPDAATGVLVKVRSFLEAFRFGMVTAPRP